MQCDAKTIMESVSTAILVTDSQLKIAFANTAAEQLFSTSRSKLQGSKLLDLIDKNETFQGFTATDISFSPDPYAHFHADMYISLYTGRARGLVVEIHRLDYQQKLNDDLQRRNQNLAARDLIRNLAHEIKNPLGGIRGAAQLLEMLYKQDNELKEYTKVIIEQADRLKNLVDRLLGPQRPNPRSMANIHYVIEKVLSLEHMATQGTLRFDKDYDPSLPELFLDVDAMQQALINIISNAVQALTESKTTYPTIKIRTRALMGALINGTKYPMSIEVDVIDNGPGIPHKIKDMLFYPMVTTRADGHGLGLSIAQNIVEHHHGTIECESEPGCTVFKIILPINGNQPSNAGSSLGESDDPTASKGPIGTLSRKSSRSTTKTTAAKATKASAKTKAKTKATGADSTSSAVKAAAPKTTRRRRSTKSASLTDNEAQLIKESLSVDGHTTINVNGSTDLTTSTASRSTRSRASKEQS